jgi:NAD(P)-dependent dehydrogenase (short-subunit alcohol dehydrogenase family)
MGKLEGKIALITGGNSGIGLATAKRFVSEGAYVFITGRRDPELAAAVKEIGSNVTGVRGDVSNLGDTEGTENNRVLVAFSVCLRAFRASVVNRMLTASDAGRRSWRLSHPERGAPTLGATEATTAVRGSPDRLPGRTASPLPPSLTSSA